MSINHLRNNVDTSKNQIFKFIDDFLNYETSENAFKIILALNKQQQKPVADITLRRLYKFIIEDNDSNTKFYTVQAVNGMISNGLKVTDACLKVVEIALKLKTLEKIVDVAAEIFVKIDRDKECENLRKLSSTISMKMDRKEDKKCLNLLKNFYVTEDLVKSSQKEHKLKDIPLKQLIKIASNIESEQRIKIMTIFRNLSENSQIIYSEKLIVSFLEDSVSDSDTKIQKLAVNALKYVIDYKPTKVFFSNLDKILGKNPFKFLLKQYLNTSVQNFLHIVHVILTVEKSNISGIESKSIYLISRELLCNHLLNCIKKHDEYDKYCEFKFYLNLAKLENYYSSNEYLNLNLYLDEILLLFIENHQKLTLKQINSILISMTEQSIILGWPKLY